MGQFDQAHNQSNSLGSIRFELAELPIGETRNSTPLANRLFRSWSGRPGRARRLPPLQGAAVKRRTPLRTALWPVGVKTSMAFSLGWGEFDWSASRGDVDVFFF